ncbi:hypothetical protein DKP76_11545 [Falsochrobactrum shanghaiense]|uniref:Uncharacterized protein n=1 Tax=Falsochrobactrum shanghaiense TaxID=2201899 RepID=A0A316J9G2_9HYPH|nr:hypothetical protein [Falsochrobactrum shanghaiense]PWL17405.1 hypothetical protein DKP76_11545 [Falsochrobactrum shanghaiense]
MTRKHGGARPGAGRKKGKVGQAKRELAEMAKEHAEQALQVLVNIALSGESEAARVSAANAILDRGYGRPMQGIDHKSSDGSMTPPTRIELIPLIGNDNSKD